MPVIPAFDVIQQLFFFGWVDLLSFCFQGADLDLEERFGGLFAAHDGDARGRPGVNKPGVICLSAHGVVARAIRVADDDGDFGDDGIGDGIDHFGAVLDNAGMFAAGANHKSGDILQENERNLFLVAVHDKTGCLVGAVVIDHSAHLDFTFSSFDHLALVGDDADGPALDAGIAAEDGFAVVFLELLECGIVDDAADDLRHIVGARGVRREEAIEVFCGVSGALGSARSKMGP